MTNLKTKLENPVTTMSKTSCLLALPAELQLIIYEMAVVQEDPLPINCGCDSAYGGHCEEYYEARRQWEDGTLHSPWQPSLTRTCRAIRADALPMFYQLNVFRAYYCQPSDFDMVMDWLKIIGRTNRRFLRDFCLHDDNTAYDKQVPGQIRIGSLALWNTFCGANVEKIDVGRGLEHRVGFENEIDWYEGLDRLFGDDEVALEVVTI